MLSWMPQLHLFLYILPQPPPSLPLLLLHSLPLAPLSQSQSLLMSALSLPRAAAVTVI